MSRFLSLDGGIFVHNDIVIFLEIFLEVMFHYAVAEAVCGDSDFVEAEKVEEFGEYKKSGGEDFGAFFFHAGNLDSFLDAHS